ncbi:hypothetical protein EJ02DRAFT_473819 [Clathrospora elynae]|uniref:Uncharacterized protein n=1 Tax=Clathrospora elynae TaxID=706981 RepID=A0A6A5T1I4_9PLEO|nr:hypothetical protein EJ02DRAFT_473819 [Clathrospora elynae]
MEPYLILSGIPLSLFIVGFAAAVHFNFDMDNIFAWLDPPSAVQHNINNTAEKGLSRKVKVTFAATAPIASSLAPTVLLSYTPPPFSYKTFRATGDSFLPHNRRDLKKVQNRTIQSGPEPVELAVASVTTPKLADSHVDIKPVLSSASASSIFALPSQTLPSLTSAPYIFTFLPAQVQASVSIARGVTEYKQAPPQALGSAPAQHIEYQQAVLPINLPSPKEIVIFVFASFAARRKELENAMQSFLDPIPSGQGYQLSADAIYSLIDEANRSLAVFFPDGMTIDQSNRLCSNESIFVLWEESQPYGWYFQQLPHQGLFKLLNRTKQLPHVSTMQQQTGAIKSTVGLQASSKPAPTKPQNKQPPPVQPRPKVMSLDSPMWHSSTYDELRRLSWEYFGSCDEQTAKTKIWQFSPQDALKLSGSSADWKKPGFMKTELTNNFGAFKRAVVLRMQAQAGHHIRYSSSVAPLLSEMNAFFEKAGEMTVACGGPKSKHDWKDWYNACYFFDNKVMKVKAFRDAIHKHYESDLWNEMLDAWMAHDMKLL